MTCHLQYELSTCHAEYTLAKQLKTGTQCLVSSLSDDHEGLASAKNMHLFLYSKFHVRGFPISSPERAEVRGNVQPFICPPNKGRGAEGESEGARD